TIAAYSLAPLAKSCSQGPTAGPPGPPGHDVSPVHGITSIHVREQETRFDRFQRDVKKHPG
ncbi:MAG: hypothetical protein ABGZ35_26100, partial [Planctomycetaceae bacterium]